ncbi:FAD binding domain-containing protein [Hirsutella rhossiliensis]|uniref:NADPH-dependent diflavin oxidoreductase 1 n=1 Tax=Hirsutella rhossiliensis TaxID=111463 RepID=A0A9P8SKB6_9HYPO|nr:FAD binding domain-containing protein [Hirsutella rhossiliensis]KAH0964565.1 FAD binding domain-containing protein [Hirsutella rhossiliensis]
MAVSDRTVLVLYGSETGNAQDMAEELGSLFRRLRFRAVVHELDAADLTALLDHRLVVFVVSTTGQGDMPHNSLIFWRKLLRKKLPPGCLASLRYTCLGLGDSTYLKFNWAARKLIRRLEQLGATTFMDPCEADEQFPDGIDGTFVRWADELKSHLLEHHPHPGGLQPIPDQVNLPPRWSLEPALLRAQTDASQDVGPAALVGHQSDSPPPDLLPIPDAWTATIVENKRMTPDTHWQDVRLVSLDVSPRGPVPGDILSCNPGDCLTVYPKNFPDDAQRLIALMGWEAVADQPLDLSLCDALPPALYAAPRPCTLRGLLLHNVDFTAVPRRSFLRSISYFASDCDQRERLVEFTTAEFLDEYFDYATRSRRTIIEVLDEFSSVRVPPGRLLDVFPLIRGRDFSIANGGATLRHPTDPRAARVELLVALVKYRTILRKPRQGLCSRYLADLAPGATLHLSHKPVLSPVHGPANARRPLVAMATGTGIAPVRSLIHERLTHPAPAPVLVFFGNRNRAADFFFAAEWQHALDHRDISLFAAFSRDQREKVYVQDLVRREAPVLARLIPQQPIFAVCGGSSKMADACKSAVFEPFIQAGDEQEQKKILDAATWWQEIW